MMQVVRSANTSMTAAILIVLFFFILFFSFRVYDPCDLNRHWNLFSETRLFSENALRKWFIATPVAKHRCTGMNNESVGSGK